MRRAAKRDKNEADIVAVLEAAGWHVHRCSDEGLPDLYCTRDPLRRGVPEAVWLEVKGPGGRLQRAQRDLWEAWAELGLQVRVLETEDEARRWCAATYHGHHWNEYPVDTRGRGAPRAKKKSWLPRRITAKVKP